MILLSCAVSVAHSLLHVPTRETLSIPILKNQEHCNIKFRFIAKEPIQLCYDTVYTVDTMGQNQ
jgi:hypothetical protein